MTTVWKIAPGERAWMWEECRDGRCITINWLNHQDFALFRDKSDVIRALTKVGDRRGGATSIWRFCREVQQGHVVVANQGLTAVVGIGLVSSGYLAPDDPRNPRKDKDYHRHARLVNWLIDKPIELPRRAFVQPTVERLTPRVVGVITSSYLKRHPKLKGTLDRLFGSRPTPERLGPAADEAEPGSDSVYVASNGDRRDLAWQQIKKRRGRPQFRDALLERYEGRCVVTGCAVASVLEAAHIDPYRGEGSNHPGNGLLLRADIHTLFDLDLLGIKPDSLQIELHPDITEAYRGLVGRTLCCVADRRPLQEALKRRYALFQKRKQWSL
jgi:hypothetical protein